MKIPYVWKKRPYYSMISRTNQNRVTGWPPVFNSQHAQLREEKYQVVQRKAYGRMECAWQHTPIHCASWGFTFIHMRSA
jgi:hypothetical protein